MSGTARPKLGPLSNSRPAATSQHVRHRMRLTRRRDTPAELALRSWLHRLGLRFRVDSRPLPAVRRRADVLFGAARVAVFVDGCFWHGCPTHGTWPKANAAWWREKIEGNRRRDEDTDARLNEAGWVVVRLWAHDDASQAARRIAALLRGRSKVGRVMIMSQVRQASHTHKAESGGRSKRG